MQASVIIPVLNEHDLLPKLLRDLNRQRGVQFEVIVADAGSTDGTREAAEELGATVVEGGLPAAGRNAGAREATGEVLVFLDADVRLQRDFLRRAIHEMHERELTAATCPARPLSKLSVDRVVHDFANLFIRLNQRTDPHAPGYCILVRRSVFEKIGGFDESLKVAEDHDLVSRAAEHGPFRMLDSTHIKVSVRRYEKEGRLGYALKAIKVTVYRAISGEISLDSDVVDYEFGDYEEDEAKGGRRVLRQLERALIRLDAETARLDERVLYGTEEHDGAIDGLQRVRDTVKAGWEALTGTGTQSRESSPRRQTSE